jgi:hypothetical protein
VDILAGMRVIQKIPARMIGIVVHDEAIAVAIPAPFGGNGPVPRRNLKRKTAREPEPVMIAIEALDVVAVGGTKVFKVAVLERVGENIPPVVRTIVSIPVILATCGMLLTRPPSRRSISGFAWASRFGGAWGRWP